MVKNFFEFKKSDFSPIKSFLPKKELNPVVFDEDGQNIKSDISGRLYRIAEDFWESLDTNVKFKDIIVTGSLMNYNWSEYSDWDLHILVDFEKIDGNIELVRNYLDAAEKTWKLTYNINIEGYEVEIYCQDISQDHYSTGQYSLMEDRWLVEPKPITGEVDEVEVKTKGEYVMNLIDKVIEMEGNYEDLKDAMKKVWKKIKNIRLEGLKQGELDTGNLVFKLIRRNGYIGKFMKHRKYIYEKQFSDK